MKHNFDEPTIQAAINAACEETHNNYPFCPGQTVINHRYLPRGFKEEAPARLHLLKTALENLPEPANAELEVFRSFFGKASLALHQLDGLGDNGDTQNSIERLQKLLEWKCTDEEKAAVRSLMQSQGLTALQVIRQALRHYQMAVQGQLRPPSVVDGNKSHPILTLAQDQIDATPAMQAAADAVLNETIHDGGEVFKKVEPVDPYAELKAAHATGKVIQIIIGTTWRDIPAGTHVVWDAPVEDYRIKPTPSTFTAHGKEWTRHVPGDSMPCDGEAVIHHILEWQLEQGDEEMPQVIAGHCKWDTSLHKTKQCIVGWRYTDEPSGKSTSEATIAPPWTPAVGDVVTLKSGGPKMTVLELLKVKDCPAAGCEWFNPAGEYDSGTFKVTSLTKSDS